MKSKKRHNFLTAVLVPLIVVFVLLCFLSGISNLTQGHAQEDKRRLEETLRRTAVACYAAEGIYPPDLAYLEEHYGVQIDRRHFEVIYTAIASNLMPDITVLEK